MKLKDFLKIEGDHEVVQVCLCEDSYVLRFHDWRIIMNGEVTVYAQGNYHSILSLDGVWFLTSLIGTKIVDIKEEGDGANILFGANVEIKAKHCQVFTEKEWESKKEESDTLENTIAQAFSLK